MSLISCRVGFESLLPRCVTLGVTSLKLSFLTYEVRAVTLTDDGLELQ